MHPYPSIQKAARSLCRFFFWCAFIYVLLTKKIHTVHTVCTAAQSMSSISGGNMWSVLVEETQLCTTDPGKKTHSVWLGGHSRPTSGRRWWNPGRGVCKTVFRTSRAYRTACHYLKVISFSKILVMCVLLLLWIDRSRSRNEDFDRLSKRSWWSVIS